MPDQTATINRPRILIVDDDPHTVDILTRWLAREGYETLSADGATTCLEVLARDSDIDVIILDVMMPGMDGLQLCERLLANDAWRAIPVILLTARDDMETRNRGMKLGVSEYLTKPINRLDLFARVRAQMHTRELTRRLSKTAATIPEP